MRFLRALFDLIIDLLYTIWLGAGHLAGIAGPRAVQYLQILVGLAVLAIIMPAIPALIGLIGGWGWLVALAGLMWGFLALLLFVLAAPLGILINFLLGIIGLQATNQRAGRRYIVYTGSILLFGMFFALVASFVPWRENPAVIPLLLLGAAILAVSGAVWGSAGVLGRRVVIFITSLVLVILMASFFFPRSFAELGSARQRLDQRLADRLGGRIVFGTNLPVCAETEQAQIITLARPRLEIPVWENCWSGWIDIQSDQNQKVTFRFYKKPEGGFLEVLFMDGSRRLIHKNQRVWLGHIPQATFRLRGTEGIVVVEIEKISATNNNPAM